MTTRKPATPPASEANANQAPAPPATVTAIPRILYGGDYNPEQWPEDIWPEDARLMREAGVNFATVGVFSWSKLEPEPGVFAFDWLDRAISLLHEHGVHTGLATPTASPPPWLARLHPDSLPVDFEGRTLWPGGRQHFCPNNPEYRRFAARITAALAERYARHPAVVLWHISNEFACGNPACYCDRCAAAFRAWLARRYTGIDGLNAAWGTSFWSQRYRDWDDILPPRRAGAQRNPTQTLDYSRFLNDAFLDLYLMDKEIIRRHAPTTPVTTNFMPAHAPIDSFAWAPHLDVAAWDSYPDPDTGTDAAAGAACWHDVHRSLKHRPFLLMEQAAGRVNWRNSNALRPPGVMRLFSHQAVARGADGVLFFQWRASRFGGEKFHSAMLPHAGPDSRIFQEIRALGGELGRLTPVLGARVAARVAIVLDWNSRWGLGLDSKPARLDYFGIVGAFHRALWDLNIAVDFIPPDGDWSQYGLVFAPALYIATAATGARARAFVENGGALVTTTFTGVVDEFDHIHANGCPGPLREILGVRVEDWQAYPEGESNRVVWRVGGAKCRAHTLCDILHLEGAQAVAAFDRDFFAGSPAITRNRFGKGLAWHIGGLLDEDGLSDFIESVLRGLRIRPPANAPKGVEAVVRQSASGRWLFLLNHRNKPAQVTLGTRAGPDLLSGEKPGPILELEPRGVAIIQLPATP